MKEQLDSFLEYLALNDNASAHTVRAYESDLSQFLTFLAGAVGKRRADLTPIVGGAKARGRARLR